jgi:ribonuclease HII
MWRAVDGLAVRADLVLVDGKHLPLWSYASVAVIGGDARVPAIAAASIVAKVTRDREMQALHRRFPQYGFDAHKGYPTAAHRRALEVHGACPEHRRSFAPVRAVTEAEA